MSRQEQNDRHIIWSDISLDLDDWRESLEELYPGYSDDELYDIMVKSNAENLYALLSALEVINEDGELERKADMFFKRTIKPHKPVTEVDTADEALAVSMGEKAAIDMEYMMELSGKSEEDLFSDLKGVIFLNPLYEYGNSYGQRCFSLQSLTRKAKRKCSLLGEEGFNG